LTGYGYDDDRAMRLLRMLDALRGGDALRKQELTDEYGVSPKTVQRDIDSLRAYLAETDGGELLYDRREACYRLCASGADAGRLTAREVFALGKILVESRAFCGDEFGGIVGKLIRLAPQEQQQMVSALLANERLNYIPLLHGKPLVPLLWELAQLVTNQHVAEIEYRRQDGTDRTHRVKPVGIMFAELYFYLIAYMDSSSKDSFTIFRVDRIERLNDTGTVFPVPYAERFSEGEFRKRVQFMYPGELKFIRFVYRGPNVEAILDRFPTAQIIETHSDGAHTITVEAYGKGARMWLRSQGEWVELLE
jgi:predicted DNA-binding transcriptional regulator YafY